MLSKLTKDKKLRQNFLKQEKVLKTSKFLFCNFFGRGSFTKNRDFKVVRKFLKQSTRFKPTFSKTQFSNRCIESNRSRGVLRTYSVSRMCLRESIQFGILAGYRKAVW